MLKRSSIGWCDYSGGDLNVVIRGKSCPISEECAHCYVKRWYRRYRKGQMPEHTKLYPNKLKRLRTAQFGPGDQPYRRGPGSKPIMFVADYGDLFCEDVPFGFAFNVLATIYSRPDADWVLLTKRPGRMKEAVGVFCNAYGLKQLPAHIWCMVSAGNQERADERIPVLLQVRAQVLGVSIEPMLGSVYLKQQWLYPEQTHRFTEAGAFCLCGQYAGDTKRKCAQYGSLNWAIVGAESGEDRRLFNTLWAEDLWRQCRAAGIPFFGKQASGLQPGVPLYIRGREIKEFPK